MAFYSQAALYYCWLGLLPESLYSVYLVELKNFTKAVSPVVVYLVRKKWTMHYWNIKRKTMYYCYITLMGGISFQKIRRANHALAQLDFIWERVEFRILINLYAVLMLRSIRTLTHGYLFYSILTMCLRNIWLVYIINLYISVLFHIYSMSENLVWIYNQFKWIKSNLFKIFYLK
jgi:hypothetical protein